MTFLKIVFAAMIAVLLFSPGMTQNCFHDYKCPTNVPRCDANCKNMGFKSGKCLPPDPDDNYCCCS
ncbi:hypothetical protein Lalb_Chr04g0262021 [Lupinus albus]|uniref:LCR-like protein n=1 Tax=Lupinus albus TaxID=3870 RepID=A0A6A4QT71_LUPAL|nr:hypothetical protein Lalb_Chr04g0262021 [Lupinus albus]